MTLAFSSKNPFVPTPEQGRWIASLSDGTTVFEDKMPGEVSAWRRLQKYIELHNLKITNLRLEAYGRRVFILPYKDDAGTPQINGYWQASRVGAFLNINHPQIFWRGIGYVKYKTIYIAWVDQFGNHSIEERPLDKEEKDSDGNVRMVRDMGVIFNDPI